MSLKGWAQRTHNLSRMGLRDLVGVYFPYPAIIAYLVLTAASIALAAYWGGEAWRLALAMTVAVLVYPLAWYLIHRFILHGRFLYKSLATATTWKRIHVDHHQDPNDLRVLFGALHTTVPTIAIVTVPVGWLIGGPGGAMAAFAAGLLTTCFYEFCHCVQHLNYAPRLSMLKRFKRLHLAHHFHNETGNFGITSFVWDRIFGTYYPKVKDVPRSATLFNLGYTDAEAARYPWVAARSGGTRGDGNPRRFREGGKAAA